MKVSSFSFYFSLYFFCFVFFVTNWLYDSYRVQGSQPGRRWMRSWRRSRGPWGSQPRPSGAAWFPAALPSRRGQLGGCSQTHCCRSAPPAQTHIRWSKTEALSTYTCAHTHTHTEEKINICYDRKMKALLRVTTQQGMWRLSDVPTHTYMHAHTFRSSLGGPSDYSITQIKPWETKINCICWLKTGELQVSPKVTLLFFLFPASLPAPSFRYSLSKRA